MQVLIEKEALNTIIAWCGSGVLTQLLHVEEFYPDATRVVIELGATEAEGDPTVIGYSIDTDVDTEIFHDQRHNHGHWLREASHELYMHMAITRMSKGPHDHTASMEDADDRPQHTMGKEDHQCPYPGTGVDYVYSKSCGYFSVTGGEGSMRGQCLHRTSQGRYCAKTRNEPTASTEQWDLKPVPPTPLSVDTREPNP